MTITQADLSSLWSRLASAGSGQRRFVSLRLDGTGTLDVHAALRTLDQSPCLLFDALEGLPDDVEFEVGGMRCARAATDTGWSLVLSLEDPGGHCRNRQRSGGAGQQTPGTAAERPRFEAA